MDAKHKVDPVYERLEGASGRDIFFRPQRYTSNELGDAAPRVVFDAPNGAHVEAAVADISQTGAAIQVHTGITLTSGQALEVLDVFIGNQRVYSGRARVVHVREQPNGVVAGISFCDYLLDIEDVLKIRDLTTWNKEQLPDEGLTARPWYVDGWSDIKSLLCDVYAFFADWKEALDKMDREFPWPLDYREKNDPVVAEIRSAIRERFVQPFLILAEKVDAALRAVPREEWLALRSLSQRLLDQYFLLSPFMHRARVKPLGYPGDYEVMRMIYAGGFQGSSLFARAIDLATLATPAAAAVRSRKQLIASELLARSQCWNANGRPLKVISIGTGPGEEFASFLAQVGKDTRVECYLFDQDRRAVSSAFSRLQTLVYERGLVNAVRLRCLNDSIKRLVRDPSIFEPFWPFDFIFCAGLFDYLSAETSVRLIRNLFAALATDGVLMIGNMVPTNPTRWVMEHHLDWYLIYRTTDELLALGAEALPEAHASIVAEATGVNPFLVIRK